MTIKETLYATIVAHVILLLLPRISKLYKQVLIYFKSMTQDHIEIYQALKSGDKK